MLSQHPSVAIVGIGHVGRGMVAMFPSAVRYDPYSGEYPDTTRADVNAADVAIVCVPTPASADGSANIDAVIEVVDWLATPWIVIRSTVPPGTTESLRERVGRPVVFWPEYCGEWTYASPWEHSVHGWPFVLLGGRPEDTRPLLPWLAATMGADRTYRQADARTVELCKYMENSWLAGQVLFANEFARIAQAMNIDYWELREMWALDPRVSRHHTVVSPDAAGFGGSCLPKDIDAIVAASSKAGYDPQLLRAFIEFNRSIQISGGSNEPSW
jgi:nucleotide sugar dehydrogenase